MPYINVKTNIGVSKDKEELIKQRLGKAIELIPGKSEEWLMVGIEENTSLYFKGRTDLPVAFVEVKIFGSTTKEAFQQETAQITQILKDVLAIASDRIFVAYMELEHWGWNGNNF